MLQSGILNSIADYLKSQQKSQMTLADTDDLFSIRPDLVAPSSHPLSHLVDSALTKFNQRRVLSGMRMPKQRRLPLVEAKAAEQPDGEKAGAGTDLAGELFPETKETKKVWEVVDTQAILGDLLL